MKNRLKKTNQKNNNLIFFNLINKIKIFLNYLFIFFLPTQLGKHFFFPFSYINGVRVDYLAPTFYLIDIVFILIIIFNLSVFFSFLKNKKILIVFFFLTVNLIFSQSKIITFFSFLKIFQFLFVFYFFYHQKLKEKLFLISILLITLIEWFLALYQLKFSHSFDGVFYFLGERHISIAYPSIAKVFFFDQEILRPYATFSHPNSLAGFYLLLYVFLLTEKKFDKHRLFKNLLLFLSASLIFLSFSKAAIFVFLIINIGFYFQKIRSCRLCFLAKIITLFALSFIFLFSKGDVLSLERRKELIFQSLKIIKNYPLFGVGLGNYLLAQKNFPSSFPLFFNQPVHNIFLLLIAEVGIPFFALMFFFLINFFKKNWKKIPLTTYYLILAIFLTGFFDHYWLTLKQNFLLIAIIFAQELKRD
jgi:hypothetical protein